MPLLESGRGAYSGPIPFGHSTTGVFKMRLMELGRESVLLVVLSLVAACAGPSAPEAIWSGEVLVTPDGPVIRNPEHALDSLSLEPLWSRASEEWGDLGGIRLAGEHVLASDRMTTRVHLFQAFDGSSFTSFGRQGEGPGELGRLYSAALVGDRVFVSHNGSLDLSVFSLGGEFEEAVEWGWPVGTLNGWGDHGLMGFRIGGGGGVVGKDLRTPGEPHLIGPEFQSPYPAEEYGTCTRATAKDGWVVRVHCSALRIHVAGPDVLTGRASNG